MVRMHHMRDHATEAVALLADKTNDEVEQDRLPQLGLTRLVEVVGEAASQVDEHTRTKYVAVPWREAAAT